VENFGPPGFCATKKKKGECDLDMKNELIGVRNAMQRNDVPQLWGGNIDWAEEEADGIGALG
jgi:hypothetical protein